MKNLISSRLFGELLRSERPGFKDEVDYLFWYEKLRNNYDDFLKQPLQLWMFIPCKLVNGSWVVLEQPKWVAPEGVKWEDYVKEYQEAKDKVFFEGKVKFKDYEDCTILNDRIVFSKGSKRVYALHKSKNYEIIEDMVEYNFQLKASIIEKLGL